MTRWFLALFTANKDCIFQYLINMILSTDVALSRQSRTTGLYIFFKIPWKISDTLIVIYIYYRETFQQKTVGILAKRLCKVAFEGHRLIQPNMWKNRKSVVGLGTGGSKIRNFYLNYTCKYVDTTFISYIYHTYICWAWVNVH